MSASDLQSPGPEQRAAISKPSSGGRRARRRRSREVTASLITRRPVAAWLARYPLAPVILLMALTVAGSVLAVGTVHVRVLLVIAPLAFLSGAWAIAETGRGLSAIPPAAWITFLLSAYSLLQAAPLPPAVVHALSPAAAGIWTRGLDLVGLSGKWPSLSLDPGASCVEALKWFCYGSMICAGAAVASGQSRRVVPAIVFASALAAALVALANRMISADSLYGLYTPTVHPSFGIAPLVNINNFAGYLNLGAFAGLGLLMSRKKVAPRWAVGLGVSIVVGLSAVCGSRAGLASLAFGMLVLITTLWLVKFKGERALIWIPASALLGGIGLFMLAINAGLWQSMINEGLKKIALISWTRPVVADFPIFGVGRGAFETVFPAYRADMGHHIYQFAENFVMQWCVEWGVPVTIAALIGFGCTLRPAKLGMRSEVLALCCGIGVLVLLLQNLLDLALEVASVSLALSALLGSLCCQRRDERFDAGGQQPQKGGFLPGLLFAMGGFLWVLAAMAGVHTAFDDRDVVSSLAQARMKRDASASVRLGDELIEAMKRHPADPYFPLVAATLTRKTNEMAWVSRAIERDPMAGRPYLVLAEALARKNARSQALHAIRLAVEREYALIGRGATVALALTHQPDELRAVVPEGAAGVGMLVYLARQAPLQPWRDLLLEEAISRDVSALEPRVARAEDLINHVEGRSVQCLESQRSACVAELHRLTAAIMKIDPKSDRPTVFEARLLVSEGNLVTAQRLLADRCKTLAEQGPCSRERFLVAQKVGDQAVLEDAISSLLADACASPAQCAAAAAWMAGELAARDDWARALHLFERAAQESESPADWRRVADAANRLGLAPVAARAMRRASVGTQSADPEFTRILEEEHLHALVDSVVDGGAH